MKQNNIFSNKITSIIIALVCCALWGSLFPCIKVGYRAFGIQSGDIPSTMLFAGIRFVICGIVLVVYLRVTHKEISASDNRDYKSILIIALYSIVLHYSFTYIALAMGEGSKSAIIKQVGFLFLSCFAFLFDKSDKCSVNRLVAGFLGF